MSGLANKAIQTEDLTKEYRMGPVQVSALQGVTLSIRAGEFVALMGASGSGKSTLLNLLGCLDTPTRGRYCLEGRDVSTLSERERAAVRSARLGFIFQNFHLLPGLSAMENVSLPLLYQREARNVEARAAEALEAVGLSERARHRPNALSGGERQRVAIARALIARPAVLLADEPTGNLDSATGAEILRLLNSLWQEGLTILLVTHDSGVAATAQRTLHMQDGRIIREEARDEVHP